MVKVKRNEIENDLRKIFFVKDVGNSYHFAEIVDIMKLQQKYSGNVRLIPNATEKCMSFGTKSSPFFETFGQNGKKEW